MQHTTSYEFGDVVLVPFPLLATIEKTLILRKLGRFDETDRSALRAVLAEIIGS